MPPTLMVGRSESYMDKRPPLRTFWFANQRHVSVMRKAVSLSGVTRDARANHVFPGGQPAFVPRQHVIEIQLCSLESSPAILAGVFVSLENIMPGELHFLLRQPIEQEQHNDARHPDLPRDGRNHFMVRRRDREIPPAGEIVCEKIVPRIGRNDLGMPLIEEGESAPRRANIDRLP